MIINNPISLIFQMSIFLNLINITNIIEDEFFDVKRKNYIIINLKKILYFIKYDEKNRNIRNKVYIIMNNIIKIINNFLYKNKHKHIYLQNIKVLLMDIKIYINNELYLDNFINDFKKINIIRNKINS